VWVSDIDHRDAPDFVDAYIDSGEYNGIPMTDEQLDDVNENHRDFVYECTLEQIRG
jgi:hypothetical protein